MHLRHLRRLEPRKPLTYRDCACIALNGTGNPKRLSSVISTESSSSGRKRAQGLLCEGEPKEDDDAEKKPN
jgi:hypothetical protein